ncbi:zinc finger domain-containing protein [Populibacterium corticicola]|uniref:Zinc finger domain-containing protein n=1 Tax=Populibacterium corticicola TaxID=1812826 RepID=A0ABW5XEA7_9MICO
MAWVGERFWKGEPCQRCWPYSPRIGILGIFAGCKVLACELERS